MASAKPKFQFNPEADETEAKMVIETTVEASMERGDLSEVKEETTISLEGGVKLPEDGVVGNDGPIGCDGHSDGPQNDLPSEEGAVGNDGDDGSAEWETDYLVCHAKDGLLDKILYATPEEATELKAAGFEETRKESYFKLDGVWKKAQHGPTVTHVYGDPTTPASPRDIAVWLFENGKGLEDALDPEVKAELDAILKQANTPVEEKPAESRGPEFDLMTAVKLNARRVRELRLRDTGKKRTCAVCVTRVPIAIIGTREICDNCRR